MADYKIDTLCVQAGYKPESGEPRVLPIVQSTTFKYDTSADMAKLFDLEPGYMYTRLANPTSDAVASKIAALEGGVAAVLTSSGQAANFFRSGCKLLLSYQYYGSRGSFYQCCNNLRRYIQSLQCYNEKNRY